MPRRKRPSPPAPGNIPPRNIAPKLDASRSRIEVSDDSTAHPTLSNSRRSTAESDPETTTCGVPQCTSRNCRLQTHLNYGRQRGPKLLRSGLSSRQSTPDTAGESPSAAMLQLNLEEHTPLPVADTPNHELKQLFTEFFDHKCDHLTLIYRPQRPDPNLKEQIFRIARQNPVFCLTLIAQAHMDNIKAVNIGHDPARARLTDHIYSQLLQMTREKVEAFNLQEVDIMLIAIVALCEYDLKLDRYDALRSHHNGMTALAAKIGGVHNLGLSLPYVLRMDRFLAFCANQLPQFAPFELPGLAVVIRHSADDLIYGSAFHTGKTNLSDEVTLLCLDAAQLLELIVNLEITFDPMDQPQTPRPKLEYFYFLRENIDVRHAILNYQRITTIKSVNKDLMALTAMKMITYYIAVDNYLPFVTDLMATRLWNLLTKMPVDASSSPSRAPTLQRGASDPSYIPAIELSDWTGDMPMLLWLLFACALSSSSIETLSFAGHLAAVQSSADGNLTGAHSISRSSPDSRAASRSRSRPAIVSPSSPRRYRYLPKLILHVAEHLVGERPLSGTTEWDENVNEILESFVWSGDRLTTGYTRIIARIHEHVMVRAEADT